MRGGRVSMPRFRSDRHSLKTGPQNFFKNLWGSNRFCGTPLDTTGSEIESNQSALPQCECSAGGTNNDKTTGGQPKPSASGGPSRTSRKSDERVRWNKQKGNSHYESQNQTLPRTARSCQ